MRKHVILTFIFISSLFLVLLHVVVYETMLLVFEVTAVPALLLLRTVFLVMGVGFLAASFAAMRFNTVLSRLAYRITAIWIGFMVYFFFAACLYGIFIALPGVTRYVPAAHAFGVALFASAVLVSFYGAWHASRIKVTKYTIALANLPERWKHRKILFVSDVHLGQVRGKKFMQRVVGRIKALAPDIVLIGGDLYDGVKVDEHHVIAPLASLGAPLGTYFITGNHEEFSDETPYLEAVRRIGIRTLNDEKTDIDGVELAGINYKNNARKNFSRVLEKLQLQKGKPSILLKHEPSDIDVTVAAGVSLQLSGHTHRAQVFPLRFLAKLAYKRFDYGLRRSGETQVLVSSGVGTWGPPFRVGTDSEVVLLTLQ